jgi:hypothetical protein
VAALTAGARADDPDPLRGAAGRVPSGARGGQGGESLREVGGGEADPNKRVRVVATVDYLLVH